MSRHSLHRHAPAVRLQMSLHKTEAKTGAGHGGIPYFLAAIKRLEDARQIFRINAGAAIRDRDLHLRAVAVRRSVCADAQIFALRGVLQCVLQQVLDRALQRLSIGEHGRQIGRDLLFDLPAISSKLSGVSGEGALNDVSDLRRAQIVMLMARLNAREAEHLFDLIDEPPRFALNDFAVLLHAARISDHALSQIVAGGLNDGERRAQFVRDASHEFHLLCGQTTGALRCKQEHCHAAREDQEHAEA